MITPTRVVVPRLAESPWDSMLREVESHVDRSGWRQPASIFFVDFLPEMPGGLGSGLGVLEVPVPTVLRDFAAFQLLNGLADAYTHEAPRFAGVAVVFEAWTTMLDPADPASVAIAVAAREMGRLRWLPGATETRIAQITSAQPTGVLQVARARGEEQAGPVRVVGRNGGDITLTAMALRRLAALVCPEGGLC